MWYIRRSIFPGTCLLRPLVATLCLLVAAPAGTQGAGTAPEEEVVDVRIASWNPSVGPANAAVTLVVFTDYLCPFCRRLEPVLAQLRAAYGDRVRVVYRFRSIRRGGATAVAAALAAHQQGKFLEFHQRLFQDWESLSQQPADFPLRIARELGLNLRRFRADLDSKSIRSG